MSCRNAGHFLWITGKHHTAGLSKIICFCLFLRGKFFTFNKIIFYNARDFKLHQRKQTAFRG
jgi:hypothetical protein